MRIEVKESAAVTLSGDRKKDGQPYSFRQQRAWLHHGRPYPSEITIRLDNDQAPFPVGEYQIDDRCFWVDRWGKVMIDLSRMQPKAAAARVA